MDKRHIVFLIIPAVMATLLLTFSEEVLFLSSASAADPDQKDPVRVLTPKRPVDVMDTPSAGKTETDIAKPEELLALGNIWQVTECCGWTGTWTRRTGTNTFDGTWRHSNGTSARDVITLSGWFKKSGQVTLRRQAVAGTYTGTIDTRNKKITNGKATWYKAGDSWSATYR